MADSRAYGSKKSDKMAIATHLHEVYAKSGQAAAEAAKKEVLERRLQVSDKPGGVQQWQIRMREAMNEASGCKVNGVARPKEFEEGIRILKSRADYAGNEDKLAEWVKKSPAKQDAAKKTYPTSHFEHAMFNVPYKPWWHDM